MFPWNARQLRWMEIKVALDGNRYRDRTLLTELLNRGRAAPGLRIGEDALLAGGQPAEIARRGEQILEQAALRRQPESLAGTNHPEAPSHGAGHVSDGSREGGDADFELLIAHGIASSARGDELGMDVVRCGLGELRVRPVTPGTHHLRRVLGR